MDASMWPKLSIAVSRSRLSPMQFSRITKSCLACGMWFAARNGLGRSSTAEECLLWARGTTTGLRHTRERCRSHFLGGATHWKADGHVEGADRARLRAQRE